MRALFAIGLGLASASGAAADPAKLLPGEWETTSAINMQVMPDIPPEVARMMRRHMAKPTIIRSCITPAQAARGPETGAADKNCTVSNMRYEAGRMSMEMLCKRDGGISRMKMTGSYTPTSYAMDGQMTGSGGGGGPMAMTMHITGRRISPVCSAASK